MYIDKYHEYNNEKLFGDPYDHIIENSRRSLGAQKFKKKKKRKSMAKKSKRYNRKN
jgi:hypothetical protein